jgi:hypothetical protein
MNIFKESLGPDCCELCQDLLGIHTDIEGEDFWVEARADDGIDLKLTGGIYRVCQDCFVDPALKFNPVE